MDIIITIISVIFGVSVALLIIFDFMSLAFLPASYFNLYYMCNDIDLIKINSVEKIDDFQCNINIIGKHINAIIYNVPCALYDKKYNNTLVKFNHYNPNECFDIISSKNDIPLNDYNETLQLIHMIYICWIITIVGGIALFTMKKQIEYMDYKELGMDKRELEIY